MILAVDQSSMDNEQVRHYINDLIAGDVMNVVPVEKMEDWISRGLLSDRQDVEVLTNLANTILRHDCTPRCQKRVKSEGGEGDFKCRKLHSVRDTPDPTEDQWITMEHDWGGDVLELLEQIGIYNSSTNQYANPFFTPTRHMTGAQPNATCNMSPIDRELFAILRAMQNLQWLSHTNGVCKYVVKYLVSINPRCCIFMPFFCQDSNFQFLLFVHRSKLIRILASLCMPIRKLGK